MSIDSSIEWTDATWNPVTGCTKVSPGCKHCYAERLAHRLKAMGNPRYTRGFALSLHPDLLKLPLEWRRPRRIFVNSMSDLFHEAIPDDYLQRVFDVMVRADWHVFQILTKRSARLAALGRDLPWRSHVWQGVSVESSRYTSRILQLQQVPAAVRFLSIEPLLGPIPRLPLAGIHWVIVGERAEAAEGPSMQPGSAISEISALRPMSPFSSSSGEDELRNRAEGTWMAGLGTSYLAFEFIVLLHLPQDDPAS